MKKILGLIDSPRPLGNCELMVKEISRNTGQDYELQLIRLPALKILPCTACYTCLFETGGCPLQDDFYQVLQALLQADALILAVPTYFLGPNSCLKAFLDRGLNFYSHIDQLWGKPSVGVTLAGIPGKEGYTPLALESFLKLILSEVKNSAVVHGALPGEVFLNRENKEIARELGRSLFQSPKPPQEPACPLCGGRTFRFTAKNSIQCMLCSNSGTIEHVSGEINLDIQKGGHDLFLSKQDALDHKQWLMQMKNRFLEQRKALKEVTAPYRLEGTWIKSQYSSE